MLRQTIIDWSAPIAAVASVAALGIAILSWIFPNSPPPFKMKIDKLYGNEEEIADVLDYQLQAFPGVVNYMILVKSAKNINLGQSYGFHGIKCIAHEKKPAGNQSSTNEPRRIHWPEEVVVACYIVG